MKDKGKVTLGFDPKLDPGFAVAARDANGKRIPGSEQVFDSYADAVRLSTLGDNLGLLNGKVDDGAATIYGGALNPIRERGGVTYPLGSSLRGGQFTILHEYGHTRGLRSERAADGFAFGQLGVPYP